MKDSIYRFSLDIHSTQSQISIPVPQFNTARGILATLTEGGKPYQLSDECRAVFTATKADGTTLYNDCLIVNGSVIRYDFTEQTTAAVGIVDSAIKIYGANNKLLTSPRFTLVVYEDTVGDVVPSEDEKNAIDSIILSEIERDAAEKARVEAEEGRAEAEKGRVAFAKELDGLANTLRNLAYTVSTVVIPASEWSETDENPAEAKVTLQDFGANMMVLLLPADDTTKTAATNAALAVKLATVDDEENTVFVARGKSIPKVDMTFRCFVLKGGLTDGDTEGDDLSLAPVVSFVGISTGSGGGGGGGGGGGYFTAKNTSGWLSKSISEGAPCQISFTWSSLEGDEPTGNGVVKVSVNGAIKTSREVEQGSVSIDLVPYLTKGINSVAVTIYDAYGSYRTINYTVTTVSVSISSLFDDTTAYTGEISFSYTPVGAVSKTVYFLIDGEEIGKEEGVTASNREQTYTIPAQSHGSHTLEVYFKGEIDSQPVESNHLYYDVICYEEGNTTPIITTTFRGGNFKQYATVPIYYIVYTPGVPTSDIQLKDGNTVVKELYGVGRTRQSWPYKASEVGAKNLSIVCGGTVKPISFAVIESAIDVQAETANLELYLSSAGRNNNEENPLDWSYGGVKAKMTGFNLKSDGWQSDSNGNTVLRVAGDARVNIPFNIFGKDFRSTGKTIEIEFATRDVMNYDAVVLSSWSGERGIRITAQKAELKSEQSEVFTQYKEDEHIRVTFSVEKRAENRLLAIYINGIMSGVVQYPNDDDFSQTSPVGISIGANDCITDIYCIRVYGNNLTRYQILDNWIADTQDVDAMTERYNRNEIFDDYGNIVLSKLPQNLPYLVVNAASYSDLPQTKPDEKTVSGYYVDPLNSERSFTFEGAKIDVQGTSSATYPRKNYKIKFKGGFVVNGVAQETYQLRPTSMPTDEFTFKADVASSEGANNVELVMFYEDTCPVKTPPQLTDNRVRQGIEGYPCLMFYYDGTNYNFLGKYNFNNDKATEEVFGLEPGDESWEIRLNNTDMVVWKDDNFEGDAWKSSFEARFPDKSEDVTNLKALSSWLKSTDTTAVDTEEEKAARLAKFKNEFEDWFNKDAMLFNYIFTEVFLMMDNRAKNAFPTRYDEDGKWLILPYDYDSAIGINNMGELKYGYHLEDTDTVGNHPVFNGQDSVLFVNLRLAFADEIKAMYQELRKNDVFSYAEIEKRFENHQSVWGEAIFNEDARFKYIEPLTKDGSAAYLPMLQGSKAEQRKWWLYNRFRYMDSKYEAGDSQEDFIKIRPYAVADITVTPYADIYAAAKFDSIVVKERALRGISYTLKNPLTAGKEADVLIYSASQLASVGDLSGLKIEWADFSMAKRLSSLKIGDSADGYDNPNLTNLVIGNLNLLKEIDVRNCSALTQAVDLSGCANIERAYFEGTAVTGVKLPVGGILKTLHLPATVTSLVIQNHNQLTDLSLPSYANLSTLRLEGVNIETLNVPAILKGMPNNSRVRLIGIDWTMNSVEDIYELYDKLDTFRGLDENGGSLDNAVVSGTIHVDMVSNYDLEKFAKRYPNVAIDYARIGNVALFLVDGEVFSHQVCAVGEQIKAPMNIPTKESTVQYTVTFKGWSADGVNTVSSFGKMGEANVTFYALFDEVARTYTIRFYSGTTLVQTSKVIYGAIPSYVQAEPTMEGMDFCGWTPVLAPVTGDTDYYAVFAAPTMTRPLLKRTITEISLYGVSSVGDSAFYGCTNLTSVTLQMAKDIGTYAFNNCPNLTSVNIPSATSIGVQAFYNKTKLTSVRLPATPPTLSSTAAFSNINTACVFYIPTGSLSAYQNETNWSALTGLYSFVEEDR